MRISRREFARLSMASGLAALLGACRDREALPAPPVLPSAEGPAGSAATQRYQEAPMLAEQVARGALPTVADRLPEEPRVVTPAEGAGRYGGALRHGYAFDGPWGVSPYEVAFGGTGRDLCALSGADLAAYDRDLALVPNLCAWWRFDADATRLTVGLRRGMRWSDGEPVSSADAVYYYAHHLPALLGTGHDGVPRGVRVVDDFTFELQWDAPQPVYMHGVSRPAPGPPLAPAHYLQAFHAGAVDADVLQAIAVQEGLEDWRALYLHRALAYVNPELPVLGAWRPAREATPSTETASRRPWSLLLEREWLLLERNPFFWQVDAAGSQLPYVDHVLCLHCADHDTLRLRIAGGEIDYQARGLDAGDLEWLREVEAGGGALVRTAPSSWHPTLQPNHSARDPRLRALLARRSVRVALSLAIDRAAINEAAYGGLCTPRQYSPLPSSPLFDAALASIHVEHDPDMAQRLLDEAGCALRDGEGYRLYHDGERVSLCIVGLANESSPSGRAAAKVAEHLHAVGIDSTYRCVPAAEWTALSRSNGYEAAWVEAHGTLLPTISVGVFGGGRPVELCRWAGVYALYAARPEDAGQPGSVVEAPPEGHWIWRIWAAARALEAEPDERQREAHMREILAVWREELPAIGVLGEAPQPEVLGRGLCGWRAGLPYDEVTGGLHVQMPQQLWWETPEVHALPSLQVALEEQ